MKLSIYTAKGGAGKTPLAMLFAIDKEFAVGTNDAVDAYSDFFEDERLLFVAKEEEFPEIPKSIDIVFDLAGSASRSDVAALSALKQSDLVIVPIRNSRLSIKHGLKTIKSVSEITKNIIVVATQLRSKTKPKNAPWEEAEDFIQISNALETLNDEISFKPKALPLKFSEAFDDVTEFCQSIHQKAESSPLARYTHKELLHQIDNLYSEVSKYG